MTNKKYIFSHNSLKRNDIRTTLEKHFNSEDFNFQKHFLFMEAVGECFGEKRVLEKSSHLHTRIFLNRRLPLIGYFYSFKGNCRTEMTGITFDRQWIADSSMGKKSEI